MAATIVYQPSASVQAKAEILFDEQDTWRFYRRDGVPMVAVPSGEHTYAVRRDGAGCECKAYVKSEGRLMCGHRLAVMMLDQQRPNPIASGSRSIEDVENHVARLHLELAARRKRLMLVGWELGEMHEDALYSRISEQLERVRATLQEVA